MPCFPLVIAKTEGSIVEDIDGNKYIDLLSSGAALNIASTNNRVVNAIKEYLNKFNLYTSAHHFISFELI